MLTGAVASGRQVAGMHRVLTRRCGARVSPEGLGQGCSETLQYSEKHPCPGGSVHWGWEWVQNASLPNGQVPVPAKEAL